MIDNRVLKILEFSEQNVGEHAPVADREGLFASLCGEVFVAPPEQPDELANYGFGLKNGVHAVVPYCLSTYGRQPTEGLSRDVKLAELLSKIVPYPILAGSAVYLGANHAMCDDIDLVQYVMIGATRAERIDVAKRLRQLIDDLCPTSLKASLNNMDDDKPMPPCAAEGTKNVRKYLGELVGVDPFRPDPKLIAQLGSAQMIWSAETFSLGKPISLQLHFVHQSFFDKDVHPYQEAHECEAAAFLHTNQHWLAPSMCNYFGFLKRGIQEQLAEGDIIKAAKRAAILFGLVGNSTAQRELVSILDVYADLSDDGQQRSRKKMEPMISDLRKVAADAYNS